MRFAEDFVNLGNRDDSEIFERVQDGLVAGISCHDTKSRQLYGRSSMLWRGERARGAFEDADPEQRHR